MDRGRIICPLPALKSRALIQQMPRRLQNTPLGWPAKPSVPRVLLPAESRLSAGWIFILGAASRFRGVRAWRESAAEVAEETERRHREAALLARLPTPQHHRSQAEVKKPAACSGTVLNLTSGPSPASRGPSPAPSVRGAAPSRHPQHGGAALKMAAGGGRALPALPPQDGGAGRRRSGEPRKPGHGSAGRTVRRPGRRGARPGGGGFERCPVRRGRRHVPLWRGEVWRGCSPSSVPPSAG